MMKLKFQLNWKKITFDQKIKTLTFQDKTMPSFNNYLAECRWSNGDDDDADDLNGDDETSDTPTG